MNRHAMDSRVPANGRKAKTLCGIWSATFWAPEHVDCEECLAVKRQLDAVDSAFAEDETPFDVDPSIGPPVDTDFRGFDHRAQGYREKGVPR